MKENHGCEAALRSPAHITLIPPFWMDPALEEKIIEAITDFSETAQPIEIWLQDFANFKPRVIYVDVPVNAGLTSLKNNLSAFLAANKDFPLQEDGHPFTPHITIATRDLYKKAFYTAWEHFKSMQYQCEWKAEGISLLRHNKKNWDVISTSQFKIN